MTPLQHYAEAEKLLGIAATQAHVRPADEILAMAMAHATLALAGATALATTHHYVGDSQDVTEWAHIVQPQAFTQEPCTDGCVDEGRNGCYARCIEAKATAKPFDEEPPF